MQTSENLSAPLLGESLLKQGILSSDQLRIALQEQQTRNLPLGKLLVQLGFVSEATLRDALSAHSGKQSIDLTHAVFDPSALALIPQALAHRHRLIPLDWHVESATLRVAMADVNDLIANDKLRACLPPNAQIQTYLAGENEIARAIDQHYGVALSIDAILSEIENDPALEEPRATHSKTHSAEAIQPIVRLVDALLSDAVKQRASDIHFEPEQHFLRIRYRIDGILQQIRVLHTDYWPAMTVRIKVMANLNIAENRAPQDGRISLHMNGRWIDFRVSSHPTLHGENVVIRILDRQKGIVSLEELGLMSTQVQALKNMVACPHGLILFTGPTGSGKTTSLYSILNYLNCEQIHIMTLEDPVEYPMPMIRQTSVSEATKLDFANGIRSMMRQDPDVILVGEIRDQETALMALRAAMTGHQVYATLHAHSALAALPRLRDLGVSTLTLASNLIGIVAQRLVRILCPACKYTSPATDAERATLNLADSKEAVLLYRARGCAHCHHHGYRGRLAIMELLRIDAQLDELITEQASISALRRYIDSKGFISLEQDARNKVLAGLSTLEEVKRVIALE